MGVTYWIAVDNKSNLIAILIMVVYLSIAAIGILFMVLRLSKVKKKNKEQSVMISSISEMSNIDKMTGCFNRKAYDEDISEIRMDSQFIYVSMDVNGLKIINDRQGHAAGDESICVAASCMKTRFDRYGKFIEWVEMNLQQFYLLKENSLNGSDGNLMEISSTGAVTGSRSFRFPMDMFQAVNANGVP